MRGQYHVWRREQRIGRYHGLLFHHLGAIASELTTLESGCDVTLINEPPTRS